MNPDGTIRLATPTDIAEIFDLICELATYERARDNVEATEADIADLLFGGTSSPSGAPQVFAHVVDHHHGEHSLAGFALWTANVSTWRGRHGIYLEDLFVRKHLRGRGYGEALMKTLITTCEERGYGRLEWAVLDWNTPAIEFYKTLGAYPMSEWTTFRRDIDTTAARPAGD